MINPYALLGVGVVVVGLSLTSYALYERGNAANERADAAEGRVASLTQAVEAGQVENNLLREARRKLDVQLVERDKRARDLAETKRKLQGELDEIRATLPAPDRECFDRPIPPAILERLRDPGTADDHKDGKGKSSSVTPDPVP